MRERLEREEDRMKQRMLKRMAFEEHRRMRQ